MPGYKLVGLVEYYLKEDKTEESIENIDDMLLNAEDYQHPFLSTYMGDTAKLYAQALTNKSPDTAGEKTERISSNLPIEEQKRREAQAAGKPFRVPEWWQGERKNYKVAQTMMKTVPRDIGPLKN
jgi:hypothetical protein